MDLVGLGDGLGVSSFRESSSGSSGVGWGVGSGRGLFVGPLVGAGVSILVGSVHYI